MTSDLAFNSIEIVVRFGLPVIIFIALIIGFIRLRNTFEFCSLDLRVVSILIIGGATTGFLNIPVFFDQTRIIFVNFGAIIIPLLLSFYFIYKFSSKIIYILVLILLVSAITYLLATTDQQQGVVLDFPQYFIPILLCVLLILLTVIILGKSSKQNLRLAVPVAYCTSTLGVVIGADVLVLPVVLNQDIHAGYFGGQGVFDYIYFAGIFALASVLFFLNPTIKRYLTNSGQRTLNREIGTHGLPGKEQPASINVRAAAFCFDCAVQLCIIIIAFYIIFDELPVKVVYGLQFTNMQWMFLANWSITIHIFYFTIFEWLVERTPGKWIVRIQVITTTGTNDFLSIFTRNVHRLFELVLGFYCVSIVAALGSASKQRIGDYFAGTFVVYSKKLIKT